MADLRTALLKANLVSKEAVERVEKVPKGPRISAAEWQQRIAGYPTNRHGEPVMYAEWVIKKTFPEDTSKECCICGAWSWLEPYDLLSVIDSQVGQKTKSILLGRKYSKCRSC